MAERPEDLNLPASSVARVIKETVSVRSLKHFEMIYYIHILSTVCVPYLVIVCSFQKESSCPRMPKQPFVKQQACLCCTVRLGECDRMSAISHVRS